MTPFLLDDLKRDEGLRLEAYPDPLSGGDPWTIGYGHTGPEVHEGLTWTEAQADATLISDKDEKVSDLDRNLSWWQNKLDDVRQDVFVSLCFNMGIQGLLGFHKMLEAAEYYQFDKAAEELEDSAWFTQVGSRGPRLVEQLRSGVRV